jgi:hypothetical protein
MVDGDSLIKARYALTVLKIAQTSDRRTAVRLVDGLTRDFAHRDSSPEITRAHEAAIAEFAKLALSLSNPLNTVAPWSAALDAAKRWLGLLDEHAG